MVCGASVSVRLRTVRGLLMSSLLFISFFFLSFCIIICQSAILPLVAVRIACIASICTEHASFYQFLMSQSDGSSVRYKLRKPHKFRLDHSTVSLYCLGARARDYLCVAGTRVCLVRFVRSLCTNFEHSMAAAAATMRQIVNFGAPKKEKRNVHVARVTQLQLASQ